MMNETHFIHSQYSQYDLELVENTKITKFTIETKASQNLSTIILEQ